MAKRIIEKCGGAKVVAALLDIDVSSVHKWKYPSGRGGTNGLIPSARQQELLERARAAGITLNPDDFFDVIPTLSTNPPVCEDAQ